MRNLCSSCYEVVQLNPKVREPVPLQLLRDSRYILIAKDTTCFEYKTQNLTRKTPFFVEAFKRWKKSTVLI